MTAAPARANKAPAVVLPRSDEEALSGADLDRLTISLYRLLARTPFMLLAVRLADLTKETQPTNVPGTSESHPNWRPKLSVTLEALESDALVVDVSTALRQERPKSSS